MVGYKSKKLLAASREESVVMTKYSLVRERDGVGDSGPMCQILDSESYQPIPDAVYPRIGCGVRVGSFYGRTYSMQDWWCTTPVTEILEEWLDEDGYSHVKFKTKNSTYVWREF
jgi:hypothetical protein